MPWSSSPGSACTSRRPAPTSHGSTAPTPPGTASPDETRPPARSRSPQLLAIILPPMTPRKTTSLQPPRPSADAGPTGDASSPRCSRSIPSRAPRSEPARRSRQAKTGHPRSSGDPQDPRPRPQTRAPSPAPQHRLTLTTRAQHRTRETRPHPRHGRRPPGHTATPHSEPLHYPLMAASSSAPTGTRTPHDETPSHTPEDSPQKGRLRSPSRRLRHSATPDAISYP